MYDFCKKTRGAVSIFLIIVLLPTMICAGLFLDLSRTRLADEVVSSSADLALNTVLSDYDKDLKDYCGLFGSSQDISSTIETAKNYFKSSMSSAFVATSNPSEVVHNIFGAGSVDDMLHLRTEGDITIAPMVNGAMNNPALIKRGINEFMKYRAPIHGAEELYEKLKGSQEALDQMQNASAEAKMIEARDDFFDKEKKLIKQAEITYDAIEDYRKVKDHTGTYFLYQEEFLNAFSKYIAHPENPTGDSGRTLEEIFKEAHIKLTKNLINTHASDGTMSINLIQAQSITNPGANNTFSSSTQAKSNQIIIKVNDLNSAISSYMSAKEDLDTAWNEIGAKQSTHYGIQYWYQLTEHCKTEFEEYASAASNVWRCYAAAKNAVDNAETDAMQSLMGRPYYSRATIPAGDINNNIDIQSVYSALDGYYTSYIQGDVESNGGCSSFRNINSQIGSVNTTANWEKLKQATVANIFNIDNELAAYRTDFDNAAEKLETAYKEADKLGKNIDDYKEAFDEWKRRAFVSELDDSELATNPQNGDRTQINDLEQNGGLLNLSKESANELTNRLKAMNELFEALSTSLQNIKYNDASILEIRNFADFCSKSGLNKNSIPMVESELDQYAEDNFSFSIEAQLLRIIIRDDVSGNELRNEYEYTIDLSRHPDITKGNLSMYDWLVNKFGNGPSGNHAVTEGQTGFDVNDKGSANDADDKLGDKKEDTSNTDDSENITGHSFADWSGAELPSKTTLAPVQKQISGNVSNAAENSTMLDQVVSIVNGSLESCRDDLFMEDYLFSMFTFDTFDNEGCFSMLTPEQQDKVKPTNISQYYNQEQWTGSDDNKTPTLNTRDSSNNWCYGGEIEYIMYGNPQNSLNKAAAYAEIYAIRYALDLSPVFRLYWDDYFVNAIALALEAFAHIPIKATKSVICLGITAAEAGIDNLYLKSGIPVLFYKADKKDLFTSYESLFMNKEKKTTPAHGIEFQYSDYLKMFMLISLLGKENNLYLRTGDVIQANMTLATGDGQYALSKANAFYTLDATTKINTMWSRLSEVEGMDSLTNSDGWKTTKITMSRGY